MEPRWAPLHVHSHFSLLDGVSKPKQIARRCKELGYDSVAMTDYGNIGAAVQFVSAMKDAGIKPILGCELYVSDSEIPSHLPVLAKNFDGWKSLIKVTSHAHHKDHFNRVPRIDLPTLADFAGGNLIAFSGHPGSDLANAIFKDPAVAYNGTDYNKVRSECVHDDWVKRIRREAARYIEAFGKDNFYLEVQISDPQNCPAALMAARAMRWLSKKDGIPRVATRDSKYPTREDAADHRVLLCSALKATEKAIGNRISRGDYFEGKHHFLADEYHIPSIEDMMAFNDEEELVNAVEIASRCESYDIRHAPILPTYPCPDGMHPDKYLSLLCKRGWDSKVYSRVPEERWAEYTERVRYELNIIKGAGLASYFLIVQDYCNWARRRGMIVGPGRGSGAGCLVSYLIGITLVDPIKYDLRFERFYNAGRNAPGHISLPDIDCDFPVSRRKEIVAYLKQKYGADKVANIATFNSMKGRGALTDVLRAHDVPFDTVKRITASIPEESRISEELQAMKEKGEEPSIIRYALENDPDTYKDWCVMRTAEDGYAYDGEFATYFAQAIRLEGTKRNVSTHAAGVVLASTPLAEMCPLLYDSGIDGYIAGMEYPDLESMGQVKLDILGVAAIDKVMGTIKLLRHGYINEEDQ